MSFAMKYNEVQGQHHENKNVEPDPKEHFVEHQIPLTSKRKNQRPISLARSARKPKEGFSVGPNL
jgi:hypothetical protein